MRRRLLLGYMTITVLVLLVLEVPLGFAYATAEQRRLLANVQHDALALSIRAHEAVDAGSAASLDSNGRLIVTSGASGYVTIRAKQAGDAYVSVERLLLALAIDRKSTRLNSSH